MLVAPTASKRDPLLMFPDQNPVPVTFIQKVWSEKLVEMGLAGNAFSLHGLRSAAATEAFNNGVPELDIQNYGGWRSTAHRQYIRKTNNTRVNKSLISLGLARHHLLQHLEWLAASLSLIFQRIVSIKQTNSWLVVATVVITITKQWIKMK